MPVGQIDYLPQIMDTMRRRSQYNYGLTANDPIIKGQVDPYRVEQERAGRRTQQQNAESISPYSTGEQRFQRRSVNENVGRNVGTFQSELMAREQANRRALDQFFSGLGLQAEDRNRYYDALYSGVA